MSIEFENKVALDLMQTLLGAITPNVLGVSFECHEKVFLYTI